MKRTLALALLSIGTANAQIPVDPLTGSLQFSVPFGNVTHGMLSAPIGLRYQGGGIRVEQQNGSAGLGWELQAGGAVVRNVKGLPDDYVGAGSDTRKGWLASGIAQAVQDFVPEADDNLTTCADEVDDYTFINGRGYLNDTEPDVFSFYAPGLSGQFVFGADGNPKVIPYQDIAITVGKSGSTITSFTVKNNLGITYLFSTSQSTKRAAFKPSPSASVTHFTTAYELFKTELSFNTVWHLTSITSAIGHQITFTYIQKDTQYGESEVYVISPSGTETHLYSVREESNAYQIASISSSFESASFEWTDELLTAVSYTNASNKTRRFHLNYGHAKDSEDTDAVIMNFRAFLLSIREEYQCLAFPSYRFEYAGLSGNQSAGYTLTMSFKDRKKQDLWGYYNGTSTSRIPDIWVNTSASDAERYRIRPLTTESSTLDGADRFVNESVIANGSLTAIYFPTGAQATIEYESNHYYDAGATANQKGAGIRVKKVTMGGAEYDSENVITEYEFTESNGTTSSGKLMYRPVFAFADGTDVVRSRENLGPDSYVMYGRVTSKQSGSGKTVYTFALPGMYPNTSSGDWTATRSKVARYVEQLPTCPSIGNQVNGYFAFPFADNTNYDFERGLPTSVAEYSESGRKVMERLYTYQRLTPSIVYVKGLRFEWFPNNYVYGFYSLMANVGNVALTETTRTTDELSSESDPANPANYLETSTTYTYNSTHKMLEQVDITNSDGIIHRTQIKYAKDFAALWNPDGNVAEAVAMKALNDTRRHATTIETIQSRIDGASTTVTGASLTLFKDYGSGMIMPYKQFAFPPTTGFAPTTVNDSYVTWDPDYLGSEFLTYTSTGLPTGLKDYKENKSGAHYGYGSALPVASFSNAVAAEVVYEGFETTTGYGLSAATSGTTAFAGFGAGSRSAGGYYNKTNVQKGANRYMAAAWVKAGATTSITFKALSSGVGVDSVIVSYGSGDVNKWKYLEAFLNVTSAASAFEFRIKTSGAADFDEIRFHPADAVISTASYDLTDGKIAELDGRGAAMFTTYDELGRPRYIKNKNQDVVQVKDYRFKTETEIPANSAITVNQSEHQFKVGNTLTFTAGTNCTNVQTYVWQVTKKVGSDNVTNTIGGNTISVEYTPSQTGEITIDLAVTLVNGGYSKSTAQYCVLAANFSGYGVNTTNHGTGQTLQTSQCSHDKTFAVSAGAGGCGSTPTYAWAYQKASESTWTAVGGNSYQLEHFTDNVTESYTMRCVISQVCFENANCSNVPEVKQTTVTQFITWINQTQCQ